MAARTRSRVASRTPGAPLMTRDTVPTPTPEAAATSAIVARRVFGTGPPPFRPDLEPLPERNDPILGMRYLPRQGCTVVSVALIRGRRRPGPGRPHAGQQIGRRCPARPIRAGP